jgi:hypothetical protein
MSKISLKHSGGNVVSLNSPTNAPGASDVAFKLPNADGSAGQFMKTDGSGNLSFGAVSSDYVKLQRASSGGGSDNLIFDDLDVATYKGFHFTAVFVPSNDNTFPNFRFRTGGSSGADVSSAYYSYGHDVLYPSNSQTQASQGETRTEITLAPQIGNNTGNGEGLMINMKIFFADSSDNGASGQLANFITWGYAIRNDAADFRGGHGSGIYSENTSTYPTGFKIFMESGVINAQSYALYGLKR